MLSLRNHLELFFDRWQNLDFAISLFEFTFAERQR